MRRHEQLSLDRPWIDHPHAKELEMISRILDTQPRMPELIGQDLVRGVACPHTGSRGISGDQVLRVLLVRQMNGFSYAALHFHLLDPASYRTFCRFGALESVPSRSVLAENLKKVRPGTLEQVNRMIVSLAAAEGVEKGRKVRIDATVVESNIHTPGDSSLLFDSVRVLARLLARAEAECGFTAWSDHTKRAKRRMRGIQNARKKERRREIYRDLLKVSGRTMGYAAAAWGALQACSSEEALRLSAEIEHYRGLLARVTGQAERRVLRGESVPASEKVVSIFEPHTDVIIKDRRDTLYGHKVYLTGGRSGLILDGRVQEGNPADTTLCTSMLRRQREIYGRVPRQAALDGGFASKENLREAKDLGVSDVCFAKKRGLKVHDMVRSAWVYQRLRGFRAGIEGMISFLKRAFGLGRCIWKGELSFGSYVWSGIVSANLLTLARHLLV